MDCIAIIECKITEPQQPCGSNFIFICLIGLLVSVGMQVLGSTMTLYVDSLGASATFSGVMNIVCYILRHLSNDQRSCFDARPTADHDRCCCFFLSLLVSVCCRSACPARFPFNQAMAFHLFQPHPQPLLLMSHRANDWEKGWVFLAWDNHWRWRSVRLSDLPLPAGESLKPFILSRPDWLPFVF